MIDQRYYTVQAAAETLAADDEQILSWIHSGQLKAVNVAKDPKGKRPRWRIAEGDLGRFLLSRQHPASVKAATQAVTSAKRSKPLKQHV